MGESDDIVLWAPDEERIARTHLTRFSSDFLAACSKPITADYQVLHALSLSQPGDFWRHVWDYCEIPGMQGDVAFVPGARMIDARWFPSGRLNFAEALLRPNTLSDKGVAESVAILAYDEAGVERRMTRRELYDQVCAFAGFLRNEGVQAEDRVAAVLPNGIEAIVAMLATAAVGAIWSSCSPEFGEDAIVDRFGQIAPRVLITSQYTTYNHKRIEPLRKVQQVLPRLPSVECLVVVAHETFEHELSVESLSWIEALATAPHIAWQLFPFSHPLCIVYSSGTTGAPKCIVHGAGGTVLQHVKEHQLHCDLQPGDVMFYYTTTGWMMWNWLVSGLSSQATIVLVDGAPFANGPRTLLELASEAGVTHFGAGARYYASLEQQDCRPCDSFPLKRLRCLLSTGSPLLPGNFDWLYSAFDGDFTLASISGGTDILSCFVLGNPNASVRRGRIQCKGLGMDVHVLDQAGKALIDQPGELVCASPFPSMPICFWNDPDHSKYVAAYFSRFDNIWCHGDWAEENARGETIIYGRSDATLNPGGVRIGTAEIYAQLGAFPEIAESIATVLRKDGDEQIVLFVRLASDAVGNAELASRIRARLKTRCSPRHVPVHIDYVPDLPRTVSGKLSEIAVRCAISGSNLGNAGALANAESLQFFERWKPDRAF